MATKSFIDDGKGQRQGAQAVRVEWKDGKMSEIAGSEFELPCDAAFLAMGFTNPVGSLLEAFGVEKRMRATMPRQRPMAKAATRPMSKGVYAAGDVRRGQSLVVWAIREGRQAAREGRCLLMGTTILPR